MMRIHKRIKNRISLALVIVLLALPVFAAAQAFAAAEAGGNTVVLGYYSEPGMMNGAEEGAEKSGYAYECMQAVASHAGWKYKYVYGTFSELYDRLVKGEIDMLPDVSASEERRTQMLFPDYPMIDETLYLASADETEVSDDFHELNGKRIACVEGYYHNTVIASFIEEHGLDCELVRYAGNEEKWLAVRNREVDATIESSLVVQPFDLYPICRIGDDVPAYSAISLKRPDLLEQFNAAQQEIDAESPSLLSGFRVKYFKSIPLFKALSDRDRKWLDAHKSLRIGVFNNDAPLIYKDEDGAVAGIMPDYVTEMFRKYGLDIPFEWKFYNSNEEALEGLRADEIDVVHPYYNSYSIAEGERVIISSPVYASPMSLLYIGNFTGDTMNRIATPVTRLGAHYVAENYPDSEIVPCLNGYDCIDSLLAGEADSVVLNSTALKKIAGEYGKDFNIKTLHALCSCSFAALPENSAAIDIINRAAPFLTDAELNRIEASYYVEFNTAVTVRQFVHQNPGYMAGAAAFIAVIIAGFVFAVIKRHQDRAKRAALEAALEDARNANNRVTEQQLLLNDVLKDEGVFLIDCVNDTRRTFHDRLHGAANYGDSENYSAIFARYVESFVCEPDRELMKRFTDPAEFLNILGDRKEMRINYRDKTTGTQRFYEMRIIRFSDTEVLQSFRENDAGMVNDLLFEKLKENYYAIFGIDLETGLMRSYKDDPLHVAGEEGEITTLSATMLNLASHFDGETKDFFERNSDVQRIKERFAREDRAEYIYKSPWSGGKWSDVTGIVFERKADGTPSLFCLAFNYLDERSAEIQEMQLRLHDALEEAQSASRAKSAFLFNMSHDIRTPMNAILGYTDVALRHENDSERVADSLRKIRSSGGHLLNLINDILEMSRIESGRLELSEEPLDIREAIRAVENMSRVLADTRGISFEVDADDIKNPYVLADTLHFNEVMINIISNAVKFSHEGGTVTYSVSQTGDVSGGRAWYHIEVADKGIGMSEEFLGHIYEEFSRERSSTVSRLEGSGLGLSIVKRIVDLVGGTIDIRSRLGEGTTVTVELPLRVMNGEEIAEYMKEHSTGEDIWDDAILQGKHVLLVEDNEMNREIAEEILTEAGLEVETAEDGSIAVRMLNENGIRRYDFIFMDIQMPVMDGYDATRAIRSMPDGGRIPIIAVSANAFEEDRRKSFESGMNAHIAKPIDVSLLFVTMRDLVK